MGMFDSESIDADLASMRAAADTQKAQKKAQDAEWRERYERMVKPIILEARALLADRNVPISEDGDLSGWSLKGRGNSIFITTGGRLSYHGTARLDLSGDRPVLAWTENDGPDHSPYLDEEIRARILEVLANPSVVDVPVEVEKSSWDKVRPAPQYHRFTAADRAKNETLRKDAERARKPWWRR